MTNRTRSQAGRERNRKIQTHTADDILADRAAKAARRGHDVHAASLPAATSERPDIDACVRRIADQHRIDNTSWLRKEIERIAVPAATEQEPTCEACGKPCDEDRLHVDGSGFMACEAAFTDDGSGDCPMSLSKEEWRLNPYIVNQANREVWAQGYAAGKRAHPAPSDQEKLEAEALGWAKATAWHHHGIAWEHLEQVSRDELLADARARQIGEPGK